MTDKDSTVIENGNLSKNTANKAGGKRFRTSSENSPLGNPAKKTYADGEANYDKFVFIKGKDCNITQLNQIKIKQFLLSVVPNLKKDQILSTKDSIKVVPNGDLQKQSLMALTSILGREVNTSEHFLVGKQASNNVGENKVIIFGVDLLYSTDDIKFETDAVYVKRLNTRDSNNRSLLIASETVILSFVDTPPERVFIGLKSFRTKLFIPQPTRCWKCQRFGHSAKSCRGKLICPFCSGPHEYNNCTVKNDKSNHAAHCINCGENHSAASGVALLFSKLKKSMNSKHERSFHTLMP